MKNILIANYDNKWKCDILREMYFMIQCFINVYGFVLVDMSHFEINSKMEDAYKSINIMDYEIGSVLVIENHDDTLVHHIFTDIYNSNKKLYVFADDIHKNENMKNVNYYDNFDGVFVTYREPFLKRYSRIKEEKVYWIPHGFTEDHSLAFNKKPIEKVLVSGKNGSMYPFRRKMIRASTTNKEKIACISHPSYKMFDYNNIENLKIGSNYGAVLNKYICCFTDCSTLNYILAKYFEIPATGSLLLAEDNAYADLEKLGYSDGVNYIKCTQDNVMEKIDWILDAANRAEVDKIRKSGQVHAHEYHHISMRVLQMENIISGSKPPSSFLLSDYNKINKYYVFGMTRNGNRAICYWLQRMLEKSIFINNASNLETSVESLSLDIVPEINKIRYYDYVAEKFSIMQPLIFFYENRSMEEVISVVQKSSPLESKMVIVLRNPYNVLSSKLHIFIKKKMKEPEIIKELKESVQLWKTYYYLSCMYPETVIIYDEWINSKQYRIKFTQKRCLCNNEKDLFSVNGHGVSLFNTSLKTVSPNELLKRYEIYKDHKLYKQLVLSDNELKIMWNSTIEVHCTSIKNYVFNKMFPPAAPTAAAPTAAAPAAPAASTTAAPATAPVAPAPAPAALVQ